MSHSSRRTRTSLSIAAVAALTLAACSSDGTSGSGADAATTVAAPTTPAAAATEAPAVTEAAPVTEAPAVTEPPATEPAVTEPAGPQPDTIESDFAGTEEAPPTEGPAVAEGKNMWLVLCSTGAEGCVAVSKGAEEAGKLLGWNVTVADGTFGIGDGYNNAIRQAIAAKADAIGVIGIDCADSRASLEEAKAAGIPTIGISGLDCPDAPLFTAEVAMNSQYPKYSDWWAQRGAAQARWVIANTDGKANVILPNAPATSPIRLVVDGFKKEFAKCGECSISEEIEFEAIDLVTGSLADKYSAALVANPDANATVAALDTIVLGANMPAAIAQSGRDMLLVAGEGLSSTMDLLRSDQVDVEIAFSSEWLGWGAVDTMNRVFNGEPAVIQGIGWKAVDKDNGLADQTAGLYQAGVDFKAAYTKLWGK